MSADNYGNEIPAAVQHTDEEYAYPPVGWKPVGSGGIICAAEEQFASRGRVEILAQAVYALEQQRHDDKRESDASTADVCTVMDELEARIKDLETVHADLYTHVHGATELAELRAKWQSVPWELMRSMARMVDQYGGAFPEQDAEAQADTLIKWLDKYAPKEPTE